MLVFALRNNVHDLIESKLTRITRFQGTPWSKTDIMYGKNYRIEERSICLIERTIDKDIPQKVCWGSNHVKALGSHACGLRQAHINPFNVYGLAMETNHDSGFRYRGVC
jgi:hypothetical protein